MRLSTALTSLYLAANAALASPVEVRAASTPAQPTINHLLSASILIGTTLKPISSVGGPVRQIEPIVGGNITSAINATVSGGFAFPQTIVNNTIELVQIGLYGVTSDGYSFYVSEKGVGTTEGTQFTRLTIEIGGPYAYITERFVLAEVIPDESKTVIAVEAYLLST